MLDFNFYCKDKGESIFIILVPELQISRNGTKSYSKVQNSNCFFPGMEEAADLIMQE